MPKLKEKTVLGQNLTVEKPVKRKQTVDKDKSIDVKAIPQQQKPTTVVKKQMKIKKQNEDLKFEMSKNVFTTELSHAE